MRQFQILIPDTLQPIQLPPIFSNSLFSSYLLQPPVLWSNSGYLPSLLCHHLKAKQPYSVEFLQQFLSYYQPHFLNSVKYSASFGYSPESISTAVIIYLRYLSRNFGGMPVFFSIILIGSCFFTLNSCNNGGCSNMN